MTRSAWACMGAALLAVAAQAAPVVVTGKVVDPAGKPAAGAQVWTVIIADEGRGKVGTSTDEGGSFRLEGAQGKPYRLTVFALAVDHAVSTATFDLTHPAPVLVRLAPETRLRGVVRDEQGRPVAGAQVTVRTLAPPDRRPGDFGALLLLGPDSPLHTVTDGQGAFGLGNLPAGMEVDLLVQADGFATWTPWAPSRSPKAVAGQDAPYEITLERAALVSGTVTHGDRPVAGVRVMAQGVGATSGWDEARSDEQGRYRLACLGHGTYNIMVGEAPELIAPARPDVTVEAGDAVEGIDFALTPGGVIEGRVVAEDSGAPIIGVRVASYGPARPQSSAACISVPVDANGAYRMRVAPGSTYVYYQGGSEEYPHNREAHFDIEAAEGQTVKAPDLRIKRVPPLIVRVVDDAGNPVPGARVQWPQDVAPHVDADAEGRCAIPGVPAGAPLIVVADDAERRRSGAAIVPAADPAQETVVTLGPAAWVAVRLVDLNANPLGGLTASLFVEAQGAQTPGVPAFERQVRMAITAATSGPDGLLRFGPLPAGIEPVFGLHERTANRVEWPRCPVLEAGVDLDLGEVALDIRRLPIGGTVVLPDETPVAGAIVRSADWDSPEVRTDADGRFTIGEQLPSDEVLLLAASPDRKLFAAEVVIPEWGLEPALVLHPPVPVSATLLDGEGRLMAKRRAQLSPQRGGIVEGFPVTREGRTDERGAITFAPVIAGIDYYLMAEEPGGQTWRTVARFRPDPGADCDLGLVKPMEP